MERIKESKKRMEGLPSSREPRKPYAPPRLIEFGSVKSLTQGSSGSGADALSTMAP